MIELAFHEVPVGDWEKEYEVSKEARKDWREDRRAKIEIATPDGYEFAAVHAGNLIIGTLAHMHWIYEQHLPRILAGDATIIRKYLRPLSSNDPNVDRIWFNNRTYLNDRARQNHPFSMIHVAQVQVQPVGYDSETN
jgi:hypothetical protein